MDSESKKIIDFFQVREAIDTKSSGVENNTKTFSQLKDILQDETLTVAGRGFATKEKLSFFYLGDLIDVLLNIMYEYDYKEIRSLVIGFKKKLLIGT